MNDNVKKYLILITIRFLKENKLYKPFYFKDNIKSIDDILKFKDVKLDINALIDIESLLSIVTITMYEINTLQKMNIRTNDTLIKYYNFIFNIIGNQYRRENIFMNFLNSNKKIYNIFFNNISKKSWEFINKIKFNTDFLPTNMKYVILLSLMVNEEKWNINKKNIFIPIYEKWKIYYYTYINNIKLGNNILVNTR